MISEKYTKAYKEVLEIYKYLPEHERKRIPKEKIEFYRKNMDRNYNFTIDPTIELEKQNISKEANAIIINLFLDYFADDKQKESVKEVLKISEQIQENKKREIYNPEKIFKKANEKENTNLEITTNTANASLIEYKESFFTRLKNYIFKILHINY